MEIMKILHMVMTTIPHLLTENKFTTLVYC